MPIILSMLLRQFPIHTAVVYCGVPPTNQALVLLSWVPVLPAAGRPSASVARRPVPLVMGPFRMSAVVAATLGSSTGRPSSTRS